MRARNIKPGFFVNQELLECTMSARLLFVGLWCFADRDGRFENKPRKIKASIFPVDDVDIPDLLKQLEKRGLIRAYESDGESYFDIPTFSQHQRPHKNESQSKIPPWVGELATKVRSTSDLGAYDSALNEECGMRKDKTNTPLTPLAKNGPPTVSVNAFLQAWNSVPQFVNARGLTGKRLRHFQARVKNSDFAANWEAAMKRAASLPFCLGRNDRGWRANIDWFLRPDTLTKILEGVYDGLGSGGAKPPVDRLKQTTSEMLARRERDRIERENSAFRRDNGKLIPPEPHLDACKNDPPF